MLHRTYWAASQEWQAARIQGKGVATETAGQKGRKA